MYVASQPDKGWLQSERRKLYERSLKNPDYVFCKLWGLVSDPRNLRIAVARVARNKGRRTAGVDGVTVRKLLGTMGLDAFVAQVRAELRSGAYRPSPVRRVLIPKPGQPGKFRGLGIPTVKDRVVQAALKNIMEPIFEADFYPVSYGFRLGRSAHGALEHLRMLLRPREVRTESGSVRRLPYQWAIEGDIKGCFDNIDHHALMVRVRRRIGDAKVNRLVLAFLKAGVLSEEQFLRSDTGTPQGGILSPLLANVVLSAIEERYERHVWPRRTPTLLTDAKAIGERAMARRDYDRLHGLTLFFPIRYADDFIILVSAPPEPEQDERAKEAALQEKAALAKFLKESLNLELSEAKTLVTPVTEKMRFLGHHVRVRVHPTNGRLVSTAVIPKDRSHRLRELIKDHFRESTAGRSLGERLNLLNPVLRGWGNFYRHAWGAKHVFDSLDHYVWWTIFRWLKKKHERAPWKFLQAKYGWRKPGGRTVRWRDEKVVPYELALVPVEHFKLGWLKPPDFASTSMESPVRNERRTPGSGSGVGETTAGDRGNGAPTPGSS
jgi:group II intron reverse transcriptase/maturase